MRKEKSILQIHKKIKVWNVIYQKSQQKPYHAHPSEMKMNPFGLFN